MKDSTSDFLNKITASPQRWRTQALNGVLRGVFLVSSVSLVIFIPSTVQDERFDRLIIYLAFFALLGLTTFLPKLGFTLRTGVLLFSFYGLALVGFLLPGLWSNGQLFLIAFITFSTILSGPRLGIAATILSVVTISIFGWLVVEQQYQPSLQFSYNETDAAIWIRTAFVLALLGAAIVISTGYITQGLSLELRKSSTSYKFVSRVLNLLDALVVVLDSHGRIVYANQVCQQVTGYSFAEMKKKYFWQIFSTPEVLESVKTDFSKLTESKPLPNMETQLKTKDGISRTVTWSHTLLPGPVVIEHIVSVGTDITVHKKAAEERERLLTFEREQRRVTEALRQASVALSGTLELDTLLDRLLSQVRLIVPCDAANIMLVEGNKAQVARTYGYEQFDPTVTQNVANLSLEIDQTGNLRQMVETGLPLLIGDTSTHTDWVENEATKYLHAWIGAPITIQDRVIAFFSLDKIKPDFYRPEHVERLAVFASQAALAMENVRLFDAEARRRREAETLFEAAAMLTSALDLPEVLNSILTQLEKVLHYDSACIFLWEDGTMLSVAARGFTNPDQVVGQRYPATDSLSRKVFYDRQSIFLTDAQANDEFKQFGDTSYVRGWLSVPLIDRTRVIGCLTVDSRRVGAYSEADLPLAKAFANQAAVALANAQLFEQTQTSLVHMESLYRATRALISSQSLPEMLQHVVDNAAGALPADRMLLVTLDTEQKRITHFVAGGNQKDKIEPLSYQELWDGLTGWVLRERRPAISAKDGLDPRESPYIQQRRQELEAGSVIVAPMLYRNKILGTLTGINSLTSADFTIKDLGLLLAIANQAAIAVENARLFAETRHRADQLEVLRQITQNLTALLDPEALLKYISEQAAKLLKASAGGIFLYRPDKQVLELVAASNKKHQIRTGPIKPGHGLIGQIWLTSQPLFVNDYASWSGRIKTWMEVTPPKATIGVPIQWGDEYLGVLTVRTNEDNCKFSQDDVTLLSQFADQAAVAIENARLFEEANQRVTELEAVRQASLSLTSSLELQAVLETILDISMQLLKKISNAHIFLYQNQRIKFGAAITTGGIQDQPFAQPRPNGLTYTVARQGELIVVHNMQEHPLYADAPPEWQDSIIGIPLKMGEQVVGVMTLSSTEPDIWSTAKLRVLELLADQAAIAIDNAWLYKQAQQHATNLEDSVRKRTFELQALYKLTQALGQVKQFDELIAVVLKQLGQAIPYQVAAGLLTTDVASLIKIQSTSSLSQAVIPQIQDLLIAAFEQAGGYLQQPNLNVQQLRPISTRSTTPFSLPASTSMQASLKIGQQVVGEIVVLKQDKAPFTPEQSQLLQTMADQAAETVGRLQLLLAAEHQRLNSLIAYLPNGVILLNAQRRIVLANRTAKKLMPFLTQATEGDILTQVSRYPLDVILATAATDAPFTIELDDGSGRMFNIDVNLVEAGPESGGWTLVIRDVTEEELMHRRVQQQERMAAVGQLAAGIAHDFNNILTGIIGFSELLLVDPSLSPHVRDDVERISRQGHRAAHLVRQILDFSRQSIVEKKPVELAPFLKETIKLLERTLPEDIHIVLDVAPGQYVIEANLPQLQQVLTNLAINARDAMPGGGALTFALSQITLPDNASAPHPDMLAGLWNCLTVTDAGAGIPAELREQIFEPFFTTKEVGKGTGLGLAQVYGIIRQHDGFIAVDSQPNDGAVFSIYLPPYSTKSTHPHIEPTKSLTPRGNQELILLVEDDSQVLDIGTTMLNYLGYQVLTAANGYEALEKYNQHQQKISLIITDMTMPQMNGPELAKALYQQDSSIKILAMTGYPMTLEGKDFLQNGIVHWLQKPLSLDQLGRAVHQTLTTNQTASFDGSDTE